MTSDESVSAGVPPPKETKSSISPAALADFIAVQTDTLLSELAAELAKLKSQVHGGSQDSSGLKPARPRILTGLYCLCLAILRKNDPEANLQQFNQFMAGVRGEVKRLHPNWNGPFSIDSVLQQGVGLYLRDAPNLTELVRSKPDYVFAEEIHKVNETDDWLALFTLKFKIQVLEAMRIQTHNPAHVPLADMIREWIAAEIVALRRMQAEFTNISAV